MKQLHELEQETVNVIMDKVNSIYKEDKIENMLKAATVFSLSASFIEETLRGDIPIDNEWIEVVVKRISKWVDKYAEISGDKIGFSENEMAFFFGFQIRRHDNMYQ